MDGHRVERAGIRLLDGVCLALVVLVVGLVGCDGRKVVKQPGAAKDPATEKKQVDLKGLTAEQIFDRMLATYRTAESYADDATIVLSYRQGGRLFTDAAPMAVTFVRPNRLRVQAYQVTLACDGKQLRGAIADQATQNLDGQFLNRAAPERISLTTLLDDALLADQLGNGLILPDAGRLPLQLAFLLSDEPVTLLSGADVRLQLLEPGTVEGHACVRIEVNIAKGGFRFWIDQKALLLRRLEYPRQALVPRIANDESVKDLQLIAHFKDASFDKKPASDAFALEIPEGAKQVRLFVPPPQPLPSDKFGEVIGDWSLSKLTGEKVAPADLQGKIGVFLWFSSHAECEPSLRQFDEVRKKFAEEARLAFFAVSTEPSSVSHQKLRSLLENWKVEAPLVRDLAANGRDLLAIHDTPTLVVLNEQNALQLYEVGVNPQMSAELPPILDKLLAGENVAATILRQQELEQRQYARRLELAGGGEPLAIVDVPNVPLAAASPPRKLQLTPRWTCQSLKQPGNLLVSESAQATDPPQILAIDEGRRLVELDLASGEVVKTTTLELPAEATIQRFRTTVDKEGRRYFAAWMGMGRHVHLFDADGKRLVTYPPDEARHDGVRDVLFTDLDADGQPEWYVGFLGAAGLHAVSFAGERQWSSRSLGSVLSLTVSSPNPVGWRKLIAVGAQGQTLRVNQFGNADPPQVVNGWTLTQLNGTGQTDEQRVAPLAGLGIGRDGGYGAVAFNERLVEQWNYPLPEGVWRSAVEPLQATLLLGQDHPAWIVAAVDGGMHVVSDDGDFSDYWKLGYLPTGLATARTPQGGSVLLIASERGVEAWDVTGGP